MNAIHARLKGFTASFRHPLVITGVQISTPLPAFSTILGILSTCRGEIVRPSDTRIGFEFRCSGSGTDLERTNRFEYERGQLKPHHKGQGILQRQFLMNPQLDVYLNNTSFLEALESPKATPTLGRSQDLAWIEFAREIEMEKCSKGKIGPTLLPDSFAVPGLILRLPEWMSNELYDVPRFAGPFTRFKALLPYGATYFQAEGPGLYRPSDAEQPDHVVYLHEWSKE